MMTLPWTKLHGASTHFPVALTLVAFACDLGAVVFWARPAAQGLRSTGAYAIVFSALGGAVAVVSGLFAVKGETWGTGDLAWHHGLVWPGFALVVAAATWRVATRATLTRNAYLAYVMAGLVAALLIGGAGYFGGELVQRGP